MNVFLMPPAVFAALGCMAILLSAPALGF